MQSSIPARVRREEFKHSAEEREEFAKRQAKRHLEEKEKRPWAPIAYSLFAAAILIIFCTSYTTYAFSRFRGQILPSVYVDQTPLGGLTPHQAERLLTNKLAAIYYVPVRLTYGSMPAWQPHRSDIGLGYNIRATVRDAMRVGRSGWLVAQLIDRLPVHPDHSVPLVYRINEGLLRTYIRQEIAQRIYQPPASADLKMGQDAHVHLIPSRSGVALDVGATEVAVHSALGALTKQTHALKVRSLPPVINDTDALRVRGRIERFLSDPPVLIVGRRLFPTSRTNFAHVIMFTRRLGKRPAIIMEVNPIGIRAFVQTLVAQVDRPPREAKLRFSGSTVKIIAHQKTGRTLNQVIAVKQLLGAVAQLKPRARLKLAVAITKPPIDQSNPAALGINSLVGMGHTTFKGSSPSRISDIKSIATRLNDDLITPGQDLSFNTLAGTDWPDRFYVDREVNHDGQMAPGEGGAMQQVATTFLRALYATGLKVVERHAHPYRLTWYEPPVGLDAIVSPANNKDLVLHNNSGKHLLIQTRVEPVRQELYIYVYGPKLGWLVSVDTLGKIVKVFPHGAPIVKPDTSLAPGERQQLGMPHDGAEAVVQRTITYRNRTVSVDQLYTHYQPWRAIVAVGVQPTVTKPTPARGRKPHPRPKPTPLSGAAKSNHP